MYEQSVHFPFIGLVKEQANNFGSGPTATLAMPTVIPGLPKYTPSGLKAVLTKYYILMVFALVERLKKGF